MAVPTDVYVTTSASRHNLCEDTWCDGLRTHDEVVPDPVVPSLQGQWELLGSAASETRLFWFWKKK